MAKTPEENCRITAYHEAGHAAVAWHYELWIEELTIKADPTREGFLRVVPGLKCASDYLGMTEAEYKPIAEKAGRLIQVLLAGEAAARRAGAVNPCEGTEDDYDLAARFEAFYIRRLATQEDAQAEKQSIYESLKSPNYRDIVAELMEDDKIWRTVETLAAILLKEETLNEERLIELKRSIWHQSAT